MKQIIPEKSSPPTAAAALARISRPHGYQFDGDTVHLHARFAVLNHAAHQRDWKLQLWACSTAPASARDFAGHIVGQVALPPMSEAADEKEHMDMSASAWPPAGEGDHVMVLALAATQPGKPDEIHDFAVYEHRQRFLHPRMSGGVGYRIEGNRVHLSVGRIENPRAAGNSSGTLALELWALAAPHGGGAFNGVWLAGIVIGSLSGQYERTGASFDLDFSPPPAGKWHFVLMLREWTAAGYVTRDFTNFGDPVTYSAAPTVVPAITLAIAPRQVAASQPAEKDKPAKAGKSAPIARADGAHAVSVNTATEQELSALPGVTAQLAHGIVNKRPFTSLDDLRRVKGIGVAVLDKVRPRLKL